MNLRTAVGLAVSFASSVFVVHAAEAPKPMPIANEGQAAADLPALIRGNNTFGLDLYAQLRHQPGNTFLSPLSLSTALAMTAAGARGETARQMADVLHFPFGADRVNPAFAVLDRSFRPGNAQRAYELHTANALWGQRGYHFLPAFLDTLRGPFGAAFEMLDFRGTPEDARRTINTWTERQTRDKIRDLIGPGVLDANTRLVLTNAIYFKGNWVRPFSPEGTAEGDFFLPGGQTTRVPFMRETEHFAYHEDEAVQVLELPYKGGDLAMDVLLPKKRDGLAEFEKSLMADSLSVLLGKLQPRKVIVSLPRFKLTATFELNRTLAALGMTLPFRRQADFSGINGGSEEVWISAVIHKAYVDVNETGTEAAAATAVGLKATAAPVLTRPPVFRADHPFLFLIRDRRNGSLLFLGCLTQPGS